VIDQTSKATLRWASARSTLPKLFSLPLKYAKSWLSGDYEFSSKFLGVPLEKGGFPFDNIGAPALTILHKQQRAELIC
jgi:hypothetical protein